MDDNQLIRVLKALAETNRFRMVQEVAEAGQMTCSELGQRFDLSQPTVSHHLKILAEAGLLHVRKCGQLGILSVDRELLEQALGLLPNRLMPEREQSRKENP